MPAPARALLLLLFALPTACATEREVTRTFAVRPGGALKVDCQRGRITVVESDRPEIVVAMHLDSSAETEAEAARAFDALQLDIRAEDNVVSVRVRNPRESGWFWFWEGRKRIDVECHVTVPRQCSVDISAGTGSITVGNVAGRHRARLESGTIFFRRIDGAVEAQVGTGDIVVSRCSGAVALRTVIGSIRVGTVGGAADVKTERGEIEVLAARGGLKAEAQAGDVRAGFPAGLTGEFRVLANGGNVIARIDPRAGCTVEATAGWGRVQSTLPLAVESGALGTRKAVALLNGGGPRLWLRASGGDVKIEKLEFDVEATDTPARLPAS